MRSLSKKACDATRGECWRQCIDQNCRVDIDADARCNGTTGRCDFEDWCYLVHARAVCNCVVLPIDCTVALSVDGADGSGVP